ncbi:MAG: hypothetical protein R3A50_14930 [Saprospiraceae bacterium]
MTTAILILGMLIAAGKAFDSLLYEEEKPGLHLRLRQWLETIKKTSFPNLHLAVIESTYLFFHKMFDFNNKLLRSILFTIITSWCVTTIFYYIGVFMLPENNKPIISVWHDYLPWYPVYLINLVFDFITIFVTLKVLIWIRGRSFIIAVLGLLTDGFIAYFLFVVCLVTLVPSMNLATRLNIGTLYTQESEFSEHLHGDGAITISSANLSKLGYAESTYEMFQKDGFSDKAIMKFDRIDRSYFEIRFDAMRKLLSFKSFYQNLIKRQPIIISGKIGMEVTEGERSKTYYFINSRYNLSPVELALSLTTLIPTIIFIFFIMFFYLAKEIFFIVRGFFFRLLKTSLIDESSWDKFMPGTHIGSTLGLIIVILKLIDELIK